MRLVTVASAFLGLLAGADACAAFAKCHCYNADGLENPGATAAACAATKIDPANSGAGAGSFITDVDADGITKCFAGVSNNIVYDVDNCIFRVNCANAGATGADSNCEGPFDH
ncbi:hypothetical protein LZ30DRAFT_694601 [Colletotrichum cereale]|nr:hypothetical protein LZ30DRAFT_694601 [Colletotrichum cereale]